MSTWNYPTNQVITWIRHDVLILRVARQVVSLEREDKTHDLSGWMRCRMGWCGLNHADSDIPGRAIPSLHDLQKMLSREEFDEIDWDSVREAIMKD